MIKFCPDLITYEKIKPASRYSNWESATVPKLSACIGMKCVAYKSGKCTKYNNETEIKEK